MVAFYSMALPQNKEAQNNNVQNKMNYLTDFFCHCPHVSLYVRR